MLNRRSVLGRTAFHENEHFRTASWTGGLCAQRLQEVCPVNSQNQQDMVMNAVSARKQGGRTGLGARMARAASTFALMLGGLVPAMA